MVTARHRKLRIAMIMDIMAPVPPKTYGGIERVVDFMVQGLVERGHEVTLFASDDSEVPCRLIPFGHRRSKQIWIEILNTTRLYARLIGMCKEFDVVHCFGRMLYLLPLLPLRIPKVQTYMCPLTAWKMKVAERLSRGSLTFVGCSRSVAINGAGIGKWHVIPNGVSLGKYRFDSAQKQEGFLLFLGRFNPVKGAHTAIRVAKKAGRRLKLAGTIAQDEIEPAYFKREIAPHIDGRQIEYIGPVDDLQKNELMGKADALLFPIEWDEPMAVVMVEALACGLPVIAFNRGSIPEVLSNGVDGFICSSEAEMVSAIGRTGEIQRAQCRRTAENRFSSDQVVEQYEHLYYQVVFGENSMQDIDRQQNRQPLSIS